MNAKFPDSHGVYRKFAVTRTDGSSEPGGKHEHCAYFVLDLEHDPYAMPALRAYADACRATHPGLALDVERIVEAARPSCNCREAACPHTPTFAPDGPSEMARHLMEKSNG